MADINRYGLRSGNVIRSDGSIVNEADGIQEDGSRLVQLTGSIVEKGKLLISHVDVNDLISAVSLYFGSELGGGVGRAIDFGGYSKRMIYIENNHDVEIKIDVFSVLRTNNVTGSESLFTLLDGGVVKIPSGSSLQITEETNPKLSLPFQYCRLRMTRDVAPTTGSVNFYIFGGNV